jgi:acyl dehydratase
MAPGQLMGADLVVGEVVARRHVLLDAASFDAFARLTGDAHPLHYDAAYAKAQGLRAPIAHGLLLVAITALGATPLSAQLHDSMVAMLGTNARFQSPAYVGDTVDLVTSVAGVEPKARNRCIARFEVRLLRGGDVIATVDHQFMLRFSREGAAA